MLLLLLLLLQMAAAAAAAAARRRCCCGGSGDSSSSEETTSAETAGDDSVASVALESCRAMAPPGGVDLRRRAASAVAGCVALRASVSGESVTSAEMGDTSSTSESRPPLPLRVAARRRGRWLCRGVVGVERSCGESPSSSSNDGDDADAETLRFLLEGARVTHCAAEECEVVVSLAEPVVEGERRSMRGFSDAGLLVLLSPGDVEESLS